MSSISLSCQDAISLLKDLDDNTVDHVITDPPYDGEYHLDELLRVSRGNVVVFHKPELFLSGADEHLFWIKTPSTKNYKKKCGRFVEQISVFRKGEIFNPLHWSQMTGVYDDRHINKTSHPWQKPLSLIERLIRIYTSVDDLVLDPFFGSGTTAVACQNLGRNFLGCDNDEACLAMANDFLGN